jgi:RNA polymerase sigma-70 factor (ECF subfamily)
LPEPEALGLLGLMLLQESRRLARASSTGEIILLPDQDRSVWNRDQIAEGVTLVERALASRRFGPYALQAAIAAVHAEAARAEETDWRQIAALYGELLARHPSPVIELNAAAAAAEASGPHEGLRLLDELERRGELSGYHLLPAARAGLLARLDRREEAAQAYRQALSLVSNDLERRFLERELARLR